MPITLMPRRRTRAAPSSGSCVVGVENVQRHLHGDPLERPLEHRQVEPRVLVPGEADEPDLAGLLGLQGGLERPVSWPKINSGSSFHWMP